MNIVSLQLEQYRCYEQTSLSFVNGTNIIYGKNAAGKTNILEAIFLFCTGRSHRGASDREMIKQGAAFATVKLAFQNSVRDFYGVLKLCENKKKYITINDVSIRRMSQLSNYLNVVMFAPEDLSIVKDGPSQRRKFLDMAISQIHPSYLSFLSDYIKTMTQRNNLLREIRQNRTAIATLDVWDERLAILCSQITQYRDNFIHEMELYLKPIHAEITKELIEMCYVPNVCQKEEIADAEHMPDLIREKIRRSRERDIETGLSNVGIHRDDIRFFLEKRDSRRFASQGQQRSIVLSLKLAQTELMHEHFNEYPILLLDDIMSELDEARRMYLAGKIKGKQVIITCTDRQAAPLQDQVAYFHVKDRMVRREE